MRRGTTFSTLTASVALISSAALAETAAPSAGELLAKGGKVESVVVSQEYPFFVISTPSPDARLYYCALSVDEAYKFYDYRLETPPTSIGSRCSQIR